MAGCNGWSNRATWLVGLWFSPTCKCQLDSIREDLEAQVDALGSCFLQDLIDLSMINWDEIADNMDPVDACECCQEAEEAEESEARAAADALERTGLECAAREAGLSADVDVVCIRVNGDGYDAAGCYYGAGPSVYEFTPDARGAPTVVIRASTPALAVASYQRRLADVAELVARGIDPDQAHLLVADRRR